jgi:hypothetical protein
VHKVHREAIAKAFLGLVFPDYHHDHTSFPGAAVNQHQAGAVDLKPSS